MLAHAEIIVGAPDRDFPAGLMVERAREIARPALQIGEHPIAPLGLERVEPGLEIPFIIHDLANPTTALR